MEEVGASMTRARMAGPGRRRRLARRLSAPVVNLSRGSQSAQPLLRVSCASLRAFARTASMVTDYMASHTANARAPERPRTAPKDGRASGRLRRSEPAQRAAILRGEPRADVFAQPISMTWAPNRATFDAGRTRARPIRPLQNAKFHIVVLFVTRTLGRSSSPAPRAAVRSPHDVRRRRLQDRPRRETAARGGGRSLSHSANRSDPGRRGRRREEIWCRMRAHDCGPDLSASVRKSFTDSRR